MALTKNLKRTGRAGAMEKAESSPLHLEQERLITITLNRSRFRWLVDQLKKLDPQGWEAWYDDDQNIPQELYFGDSSYMRAIFERIERRIAELQSGS